MPVLGRVGAQIQRISEEVVVEGILVPKTWVQPLLSSVEEESQSESEEGISQTPT